MPETKLVPVQSILNVTGTFVSIFTYYGPEELPNVIQAFVAQSDGILNNVPYQYGDLVIQMKNSPDDIDFLINDQGELIIQVNTGDADNYSISPNGDLLYTIN